MDPTVRNLSGLRWQPPKVLHAHKVCFFLCRGVFPGVAVPQLV